MMNQSAHYQLNAFLTTRGVTVKVTRADKLVTQSTGRDLHEAVCEAVRNVRMSRHMGDFDNTGR